MTLTPHVRTRSPAHARVRLLRELGPPAVITLLLCCKLIYFSALLPGEWWLSMNTWWTTDQDPITGWPRSPSQILQTVEARPHILSATLGSLLVLFGPLLLVPAAGRLLFLLVLDFALTLLGIAGFLHYRFFGDVLSVSDLYVVHQLPVVVPSIIRQLHPLDSIYFLDIVAGLLFLVPYWRAGRRTPGPGWAVRSRMSAATLGVGLLVLLPTGLLASQDEDNGVNLTTLRYEIAATVGILPYHLYDLWLSFGPGSRPLSQDDVERARGFIATEREQEPPPSDLYGVARGRNVILISAESFQAFLIGLEVDGQPVAPRLAALAQQSLYFDRFHDQTHLGTTSDAEFMALNSLHPLAARALAYKFAQNRYYGLPWILGANGYNTLSTVASPGGIWSMTDLHRAYGFQHSYYEDSYQIREHFGEWASDGEFFPQAADLIARQQEPFFTFMLSSSNHHPYPLPPQYRELRLGSLEGTLLGDYLQSAHYFDRVFGEFVDTLRERGILDRTVLVVYGDHHGFVGDTPEIARLLGYPESSEYDHFRVRKRVPFLVRLPNGQAAGPRSVVGGHVDIAPTILGLLGIEDDRRVMLGRDLTRSYQPLVVFRDGSFADGEHYFINRLGPAYRSRCYEIATGRPLDCQTLEASRRAARQRLGISDLIIRGDLIPELAR